MRNGLIEGPRRSPARWFCDHRGSELCEEITALPEYYPTRTETALLGTLCEALRAQVGEGRAVVEFGSGSSTKTPIILECLRPSAYVPIDISGDFLRESSRALSARFPDLLVPHFEAGSTRPPTLQLTISDAPQLGFFPGTTIAHLTPHALVALPRPIHPLRVEAVHAGHEAA